ncbi:hypothetical protein BC833DRAFT_621624 [Globomyces pollinis-pini]|nr:hypothetical protein BC833DRAFT_621624 [Globomyces pollinis-pini]KAJ2996278.1 hypothetical protein HDV02_006675 [Globomyces sp. JEL0801]
MTVKETGSIDCLNDIIYVVASHLNYFEYSFFRASSRFIQLPETPSLTWEAIMETEVFYNSQLTENDLPNGSPIFKAIKLRLLCHSYFLSITKPKLYVISPFSDQSIEDLIYCLVDLGYLDASTHLGKYPSYIVW